MIYDIGLTVAYEYDHRVANARHVLRLIPADIPGRAAPHHRHR